MIKASKQLAMVGLVAGVGLLGAGCDGRTTSPPAAPQSAAAGAPTVEIKGGMTQTPSAAVGAVKSLEGTGKQSSGNFTVSGAWKLDWSATGPIQVRVMSGETFEQIKVLNAAAGGEEMLSGSCTCYLEVSSTAPYKVTVTDLPS